MLQECVNANKIFFGEGTKLVVQAKNEVKPEYYKVNGSCLATDFTRHNASGFTKAEAVRYTGQNYYSSFTFDKSENCPEEVCGSGSSSPSAFETDEKVNYFSLGLYWLRILFVKTVVFNVLMTFKAWMS
ncbi:M1-specific T cell receptor alpha chain-like [Labeo rohita]|uniref:M1-specific T cell receptor alpha chain-like n=1 Tax=Labeo rohita TaxID=84645 RepID=UPI0021E2741D|nr:M1-specific T cell receptor alpha chain-like [Labeo rohita]